MLNLIEVVVYEVMDFLLMNAGWEGIAKVSEVVEVVDD